jgi:hypothetical protein
MQMVNVQIYKKNGETWENIFNTQSNNLDVTHFSHTNTVGGRYWYGVDTALVRCWYADGMVFTLISNALQLPYRRFAIHWNTAY